MAHAWSRRAFLRMGSAVGTTVGATAFAGASSLVNVLAASQSVAHRSAEDVAQDEFYWREVQLAFKLDRSLTNLNNGFTCPCPRVVLESAWRYQDMVNMLPVHYQTMVARNIQTIRRRMAAEFGCGEDEMALTRGASESLQIVQMGLDMEPWRRGHHHRAGLRPHADDLGPTGAA